MSEPQIDRGGDEGGHEGGDAHERWAVLLAQHFDGELAADDEPALLAHLATCARCEAELETVLGLAAAIATPPGAARRDAALAASVASGTDEVSAARVAKAARVPEAPVAPPPRIASIARAGGRRRWPAGVALAAAAGLAIAWWARTRPPAPGEALALAPSRALEVRFSAAPFAAHRPYAVVRGAQAREQIPLGALAALERSEPAALVAALASSGDLARAQDVARGASITATDRAAVALVARRPEDALALLDGEEAPAARWNAALAARELGFPNVARVAFSALAAGGEPGWSEEAARHADSLTDGARQHAAFRAFQARGLALVAGTGPMIEVAEVAEFPAFARIYFLDALRTAGSRDAALALGPLADALDRASGTTTARDALSRVAAARFDVRAPFIAPYRALVAGTFDRAQAPALLDALARAGRDVDDLFIGALVWTGQLGARIDALAARVAQLAPRGDPWFELLVTRERLVLDRAARGAAAVVGPLRAAAEACGDAWAYRCAQLSLDAADALTAVGRDDEALRFAMRARAQYVASGAPLQVDRSLAYLGELARYRDRRALAQATFQEVELAAGDCALVTYAKVGRAKLALVGLTGASRASRESGASSASRDGRLAQIRALLPAPEACGQPPDEVALEVVVDLARQTEDAGDRARAEAWLAAARRAGDRGLTEVAEVGAARLAAGGDPRATGELTAWLAAHPASDVNERARREWATSALIAAAGERGDWAAAAAAARAEVGGGAHAGCEVVVSLDQDRQTVALRGRDGQWRGEARRAALAEVRAATFVPRALLGALEGCARVEVLARPPLHGRVDLLPPTVPWLFVAGPPRPAARRAPRAVIVSDVEPPDGALDLPRLDPRAGAAAVVRDAVVVRGPQATPSRVLAELADATYVQIDAHGIADAAVADASFLALSPEPSGRFMLDAATVAQARLAGPVVVLAACRGARLAPYLHRRWTLPDAFLAAGAHAVIATDVDVPDAAAGPVFDELRRAITGGVAPATAVAALRAKAVASDPASWVARIAVFE